MKRLWQIFRPFSRNGQKQHGSKPDVSFQQRLGALKLLPPFFKEIWQISPAMTLANTGLRLIKAFVPITMLYVGKLIIDEVVRLHQASELGLNETLIGLIALEFGLAILSDILNRSINLVDNLLGDRFANESSEAIMRHAGQLDLQQFEDTNFYDKLEKARRQTNRRTELMTQVLTELQNIISILIFSGSLVAFNPWLILLVIVAVIPAFLNETYYNEMNYSLMQSWTPERRELDYYRYIGASDETAKEIKLFGLSDFLTRHFKTVADKYYQANKKIARGRAFWGSVFAVIGSVGYYAAYVVIIIQTVNGQISVGDLTFLSGSFTRLKSLMESVLNQFSRISESALYLQDYFDFFQIQPRIQTPAQPRPFPQPIQSGFTFEEVGFQYQQQDDFAVRHLNFHLEAGEKLALVGENGSGKTTLIKLLARLYDPTEGRILLDGVDLREYDPEDLRKNIGIIFQDFVKFQMTAAKNIGVGQVADINQRDKIDTAAQKSLAKKVIEQLPEGYEQVVGHRFRNGVDLSGGEWQKIAIARAYMRDARFVVLDEPTSALDARAEYEVFQRFMDLTRDKTAVLISHRFSTVRMADRILVLEGGTMQDIGSHEELMAKDGKYAELFSLQAMGYQ